MYVSQSIRELGDRDRQMRGFEFVRVVKHFAGAKGRMSDALAQAEQSRAPERVISYLKAAVGAGSVDIGSPTPWGSTLAGYNALRDGFFASLRGRSAFFAILGDAGFTRVPMRTRVAIQSSNATGYIVGHGKPKPLSRLDFTGANLDPVKAAALIVTTEELLEAVPAAEAAFGRELRGAVADVVDQRFFELIGGVTPMTATAAPLTDLQAMLDAVNTHGTGALYWIMGPKLANILATQLTAGNALMFPGMSPIGGQLLGLPALVTAQTPASAGSPSAATLWLVDASGIVGDAEEVVVRMSREGTVEMSEAPAGDALTGTGTSVVSLWQTNSVGILAEIYFAAHRFRNTAVAVLEGIAW